MSLLTCRNCGAEFDTEREPVTPHQNTERCSSCGHDHSATADAEPATAAVEPVAADGGATPVDVLDDLRAAVEENDSGGDLHVHFHMDG